MRKFSYIFILMFVLMIVSSQMAWAEDALDTGDNAWILTASALVILMAPGLALFYGGLSSVKNINNMIMMVFMCMAIISVQWVFWGYSLAFAEGNWMIGGLATVGLHGITPDSLRGTLSEYTFVAYQATFAIITVGLILGAVEGRMKFGACALFIPLWATACYDPVCHWVWGGGWLGIGSCGFLDFAGGTVVHINAGAAALALVLVLGKRKAANIRPPANVPMIALGAGLLWFGWFGFNAGSELAADGRAAFAWLVTNTAAATAAFTWVVCEWLHRGKPTLSGLTFGAIAGLVAITPASGFVGPLAAIQIAIIAGVGCYFASVKMKAALGYDDALDVVGIHGIGGTIGVFATGLYCTKMVMGPDGVDGFFIGWGAEGLAQLGTQCVGLAATWGYAVPVTLIIAYVVKATVGLRTSEAQEDTGLDLALHGETGYHLETEAVGTLKS